MTAKANFNSYPLPKALTRRVVTYLNVFRLFISLILLAAFFGGALVTTGASDKIAVAGTVLVSYFIMAAVIANEARRATSNPYFVAQISLFNDVLFLSVLLFLFGGMDSGITILLIFSSASAAILLPFRLALFITSLAVLAFIGQALWSILVDSGSQADLINAALYGITTFIVAILVNILSYWLKDYRLIAEQQAVELTRLEQINELVIRRMRSGVLALDTEGDIQLMNESAWFLLGSPPASRKALSDVSPELDASLNNWRQNPSLDIEALTLNASQARVLPKFVSLPGRTSIRVLIFLEDNDVVYQRAQELSANSLAQLSGNIAHEIRNPLAAISHAAQLLDESEDIVDADLRLVNIIHNQSRRMNGIVENILQLSRREKSRPDIFEIKQWLQDLADEVGDALPEMHMELDLGHSKNETLVMFDRGQLHQVLWQLLENAMRHAGQDGLAPHVMLRMTHQPSTGYCVVSVIDNGAGIEAEQMGRIFDPFFTTHKQGSGLGLYISRQLCEVNQAELTVDSTPGTGTRFHVRIALARSETKTGALSLEANAQ